MKYISYAKTAISKILDKTIGVFEMAILGIIVISTLSYAPAWQAPGGNPPIGNTDSPINTGSAGQAKSGGLILNSGGAATGLIVVNGNVGIGTTAPVANLHITNPGFIVSNTTFHLENKWGETFDIQNSPAGDGNGVLEIKDFGTQNGKVMLNIWNNQIVLYGRVVIPEEYLRVGKGIRFSDGTCLVGANNWIPCQ